MIGPPPSQRPMWHDPAAHARDFAWRYAELLDQFVAVRMEELGLSDDQMGMPDRARGIPWATFHPGGIDGGNVFSSGRLIVDSGVLNDDLLTRDYAKEAADLFRKARLRDRIDAIIAHEYEEHRTGSHVGSLKAAPETILPISDRARVILRAMEIGWGR